MTFTELFFWFIFTRFPNAIALVGPTARWWGNDQQQYIVCLIASSKKSHSFSSARSLARDLALSFRLSVSLSLSLSPPLAFLPHTFVTELVLQWARKTTSNNHCSLIGRTSDEKTGERVSGNCASGLWSAHTHILTNTHTHTHTHINTDERTCRLRARNEKLRLF